MSDVSPSVASSSLAIGANLSVASSLPSTSPSISPLTSPASSVPPSSSSSAVLTAPTLLKAGDLSLSSPAPSDLLRRPSGGLSTSTGLLVTSTVGDEHTAVDSPLSVEASTCCSSAASSRAPSPFCSSQPGTLSNLRSLSPATTPPKRFHPLPHHHQVIQVGPPSLILHSPAVSPVVQPLSPSSPTNSSDSLSSTSSSSSSSSFTYGKDASGRGERGRLRGKRVPLSQTQKAVLEDHFLTNHYPTREEKTALGQRINLTGDKVHKWYDNRRTKLNKEGKGARRGGGEGGVLSHGLYDEASGSLRPHPYAPPMQPIKSRSPSLNVAVPILPLQPQHFQLQQQQMQLQQQQLQMQQNAQMQQLIHSNNLHGYLHPSLVNPQHLQQQQVQAQQQVQQDALLRQLSMNGPVDPRLALLSPSQLNFLHSASISPMMQQQMALLSQAPSSPLSSVPSLPLQSKPTTPPASSTSAFHAVGHSSTAASPVSVSARMGGLPSLQFPSSVPASPLTADSLGLTSPRLALPPLAFRSVSAQDVSSFNPSVFSHPSSASYPSLHVGEGSMTAPSTPSLTPSPFTCTPTATGFSLYRPFPSQPLK